jgi:hypothetical protein
MPLVGVISLSNRDRQAFAAKKRREQTALSGAEVTEAIHSSVTLPHTVFASAQ